MSVQMELHKIIISEMQDQQIIVLKEVDGDRKFPIVIGSGEAYAIDRRLKGIVHPRPLTHDLLASVIEEEFGIRDGFRWSGQHKITRKAEWPGWTPPSPA